MRSGTGSTPNRGRARTGRPGASAPLRRNRATGPGPGSTAAGGSPPTPAPRRRAAPLPPGVAPEPASGTALRKPRVPDGRHHDLRDRFGGDGRPRDAARQKRGCPRMRVFVAGATGVIGVRLLPLLCGGGHQVCGMTRSPWKADAIRALGAEPVVCGAFDASALEAAVVSFRPDVVVHQLTDLPDDAASIPQYADANARIRREGTRNLLAAAGAAGARQSSPRALLGSSRETRVPRRTTSSDLSSRPAGSCFATGGSTGRAPTSSRPHPRPRVSTSTRPQDARPRRSAPPPARPRSSGSSSNTTRRRPDAHPPLQRLRR
jgi:hypothetical protein